MGLRITTNVASIDAQKNLAVQKRRASHALAALSSGSRIVTAADDPAGLAISENLKGQIHGIRAAKRNASNATSLVQVSEGGLNEISNILIRLRELGVQAASDNIGHKERGFLNVEAQQLLQEADRIAKTTRFGNMKLLDGSGKRLQFQVGPFAGKNNIISYHMDADARASTLGIEGLSVASKDGARDTLRAVDKGLDKVSKMRADFGAVQSRLQATVSNLEIQNENLSAANSRIRDTNIASETARLASANILEHAGISVLAQANQSGQEALRLIG